MPIQITAKRDGFRRCGMAHSDKTQTYADGHFSPSVLAELMAE
ncbi:HI1506-related protein, partial [Yersinia enterocolitica]